MNGSENPVRAPQPSFLVEGRVVRNIDGEVVLTLATGLARFTAFLTEEEARHLAEQIQQALKRCRPG